MQPSISFFRKIFNFAKSIWGIMIIIFILILGYFIFHKKPATHTFVTVTKGSITESVSVTGNTTPIQSVSLGFGNSGTIASVSASVGDNVVAGQTLARLDTGDLSAQLKQAQAVVLADQAKLEGLKAGAQPEDIAASQAALAKAEQDLTNMYGGIINSANDAYAKANDAVRSQLGNLFSNPENTNVQLTFTTNNSQAGIDAKSDRVSAGSSLDTWQTELAGVSTTSSDSNLDIFLQKSIAHLTDVRTVLTTTALALNSASNLDATTLASYKAEVATGLNEVNTVTTNLTTISQNIASQKLIVAQAQANLSLKQAGSTQQDIDAQSAVVAQAEASVESVQAKLSNSVIVAPINGVVTQFDAKVGQTASPATVLVSIISNNQFEVDAQVPETDIGKVSIGNPVDMTFDAFVGQTFTGKLFYIDPAQTINQGVVDYKIKVSFDSPDPKMKSGLTANLTIKTKTDDNVLILPQYAVLQNDQGTFVQTLVGSVATQTPITIGIQDENGNVEVLSGVTEGEQVLNIGLK